VTRPYVIYWDGDNASILASVVEAESEDSALATHCAGMHLDEAEVYYAKRLTAEQVLVWLGENRDLRDRLLGARRVLCEAVSP